MTTSYGMNRDGIVIALVDSRPLEVITSMFPLPPGLACHFRNGTGQIDYLRLLRTPDTRLVELARQLPEDEWVDLYTRLRQYQPGFLERMAAAAAGIDTEAQRRRFVSVLEKAANPVAA